MRTIVRHGYVLVTNAKDVHGGDQKGGYMVVQVIEDYDKDGNVSWIVSFTCNNPELEDSVVMASKQDAFKLKEILEKKLEISYAFRPRIA